MTGSRPGQGEIRSEPDRTAPESEQTQDEGVGSLFGAAQEEIVQQFRMNMAYLPRHLSKDERAAALRALKDEMQMHLKALSQRRTHYKPRKPVKLLPNLNPARPYPQNAQYRPC